MTLIRIHSDLIRMNLLGPILRMFSYAPLPATHLWRNARATLNHLHW